MLPSLRPKKNPNGTHKNLSVYSCKTFLFSSDVTISNSQLPIRNVKLLNSIEGKETVSHKRQIIFQELSKSFTINLIHWENNLCFLLQSLSCQGSLKELQSSEKGFVLKCH